MSDKRRATQFEDLPEEIVVDQILIRLPSKDVGRCRAVSTSWRSATSMPQFMLEHHRRQLSLPIIDGNGRPSSQVVLAADACSQQELWPFPPGVIRLAQKILCLCAACDGLLIVSQGPQFYICNPVTREHALLPQPQLGPDIYSSVNVIGFYRHNPTGEYRVLWVSKSPQSKASLYALTVGASKPRQVTVSPPSMEHELLMCCSFSCPPPTHHRGSLHWCSSTASDNTGGSGDIIVFDTEAESFRWMHSPIQLCSIRSLFSMKGALAFWAGSSHTFKGFTAMDIWVMQDYQAEIWTLKYRIDVSMLEESRQLYLTSLKKKKNKKTPLDSAVQSLNDMAVLNERELLIMFNAKHVLRCDVNGNFLGIVNIGKSQYCMHLTQHRLQESIIPIPSHQMQGKDEEPPFSKWHV